MMPDSIWLLIFLLAGLNLAIERNEGVEKEN